MDKKILPVAVGEFVFVKHEPRETEQTTQAGIIVTVSDRQRDGDVVNLAKGTLISFGNSVKDINAKVGDTIFYNPYDSQSYFEGEERYDTIHMSLIKAVLPCED
jgi:co-chaperonin GroES (HSP10)